MKSKLFFILLFAVIMLAATPYFLQRTIIFKISTDSPNETITLRYVGTNDKPVEVAKKIGENGKVEFLLTEEKISLLKIVEKQKVIINSIIVKAQQKQKLTLNKDYSFRNLDIKGSFLYNLRYLMKIAFYAAILCFMIPYLVRRGCFSESSLVTRELLNIDALRILYTLGIVCCHFFDLVNIPNYGGYGVEFFFVLSGYFLSTTFRPDKTATEFLKKKIIAWLPLIMFGSFLCGGYLSCFKDIFFLQNTGLGIKNIANEPAWFLGVLFWVSLFYFYIHKALSSQARNLAIGTIAFVSCIICAHCRDLRFDLILSYIPSGMIRGLACVGAGCLLAQICTRTNEQPTKKQYLFYSAVECLVLTWIVLRIFVLFYPQEWIFCVITSLFIIYLFIQKKGIISNLFEKKKISLISRYCLAIYLTHYSVSDVAKTIAEQHHSAVMDHKLLFIFGILFITSLTGIFSYHAIQKPAEKWLKEHWR